MINFQFLKVTNYNHIISGFSYSTDQSYYTNSNPSLLQSKSSGVTRAVDLCAAPGSWSQVLVKRLYDNEDLSKTTTFNADKTSNDIKIVSVDIQTMAPIDGVTMIQGDITSLDTAEKVIREFQGSKAQLVVCDGAPDVTGQHDLDEYIQAQLLLAALNITTFIIEKGGTFVAKIFRGFDITLMVAQFRLFFENVQVVKPKSSRMSSIEAFIVCRKFELPTNYKPRMFSLLTEPNEMKILEVEASHGSDYDKDEYTAQSIIPFLICGDLNKLKISH